MRIINCFCDKNFTGYNIITIALLNKATNTTQSALPRLTALGANFLVVSSLYFGSLPETHALAAAGKLNLVRYATQRTHLFNKKLTST